MTNRDLTIRAATPDDGELIHRFIVELAVYEREPDAVEATPESLRRQLQAEPPPFECLIGETTADGPVGFAVYFQSYSTWKGQPGLYLEDLYVSPEHRGRGFGAALLTRLAAVAVERGCPRVDWQVLDWNTPSIEFYESIGAEIKRDWIPCRLTGEPLQALATTSRG